MYLSLYLHGALFVVTRKTELNKINRQCLLLINLPSCKPLILECNIKQLKAVIDEEKTGTLSNDEKSSRRE